VSRYGDSKEAHSGLQNGLLTVDTIDVRVQKGEKTVNDTQEIKNQDTPPLGQRTKRKIFEVAKFGEVQQKG